MRCLVPSLRMLARDALAVILGLALTSCGGGGAAPSAPPKPSAPAIASGSVSVAGVNHNSATITWQTDQGSTSQVDYGPTAAYGSSTPLDNSAVIAHSVAVAGLSPGTTYHFRVRSTNANGSALSSDSTFATAQGPPTIITGSIAVSGVTSSSATLTWQTDQSSSSQVQYGPTTAYGFWTPFDNTAVTLHSVKLTDLWADTTYHFRIFSSVEGRGGTTSDDVTFRTAPNSPAIDVPAEPRTIALVVSAEVAAADTGGLTSRLAATIESDYRARALANDPAVSARIVAASGDPIAIRALLRGIDHLWGAILIGNVASPWIIDGQLLVSATYADSSTNHWAQPDGAPAPAAVDVYREEPLLEAADLARLASAGRIIRQDFHLQALSAAYSASASESRPDYAKPFDMPYKVPGCSYYQIAADGRVTVASWNMPPTPECIRNVWISRIVGANQQILSFIQRDLNTRYQPAPLRKYGYLRADWEGGFVSPDMQPFWSNSALYAPSEVNYVNNYAAGDTAASRLAVWKDWLAGGIEMAAISVHGAPELIQFEGPGITDVTYSSDAVALDASGFAALPNHSRVLDLRSCSVGDYFYSNFIAGVALYGGDALLVNASTVTLVSFPVGVESAQVQKKYSMLANGATFADIDMSPEDPLLMFGDPTIALRPKPPTSGRPVLSVSVDGTNFYRFHGTWAALDVPFAVKSVADAWATQVVTLRNDGDANLAVQLTFRPDRIGVDGVAPDCTNWCSGPGFGLQSPVAMTESVSTDLGNVVFTIPPGRNLAVTYFLAPMILGALNGAPGTKLYGNYTGRFQIFTVDPADHAMGYSDPSLGRLDLYLSGSALP